MKLTSETALGMVERIEALSSQIDTIYREARAYDGINNDAVIRDIIEARAAQRSGAEDADMLLRSFDAEEEE